MRIQMAFRQAPEKPGERFVHMVAGFVSCMREDFVPERINALVPLRAPDGGISRLVRTGNVSEAADRWGSAEDIRTHDLGGLVIKQMWPLPAFGDLLPIFLRETLMQPVEGDDVVLAFSGLLISDAPLSLDCDAIHSFEGVEMFRGADLEDVPPMVQATKGASLNEFFKMPVWGWGAEPVGLPSTMHLDINHAIDRHREISMGGDPDGADAEEYAVLTTWLKPFGLGEVVGREAEFDKTIRDLYARRPDLVGSSSVPRTKAMKVEAAREMSRSIYHALGIETIAEPEEGQVTLGR